MEGHVEFRAEGLKRALQEAGERAEDLTPLMDAIGSHLVGAAQKRIDTTNVSPEGVAWPKSFRAIVAQGGPTLYESGRLRDSITHAPTAREVEIGSNLVYAAIHQFGAEQGQFGARMGRTKPTEKRPWSQDYFILLPWGDIPARPYLGLSAEDETIIGDLVQLHLDGALGDVV